MHHVFKFLFLILIISNANLMGHNKTELFLEKSKFNKKLQLLIEANRAFLTKFRSKEAVTLFDSKPFLDYYMEESLGEKMNLQRAAYFDTINKDLKEYFTRTHQTSGFEELKQAARQSAFLALIKNQAFFKKLLSNACHNLKTTQNQQFVHHCREVIQDIEQKSQEHPSIHGHPRDLYHFDDIRILRALGNKKHYPSKLPIAKYSKVSKEIRLRAKQVLIQIKGKLEKADLELEEFSSIFEKISRSDVQEFRNTSAWNLTKDQLDLIIDAKHSLMNIKLNFGRNFDLQLLMNHPSIRSAFRTGLQNLVLLDELHGENIDLALLDRLKNEHNQSTFHPQVVIEGAGPTGLLMAITQYQAGAAVALFEKRSLFYDRTQIVRLDPIWMAMLKFYLGEEYYRLFEGKGHRGIIRSDGFGEIATLFLEISIHNQLTKLISMLQHKKNDAPAIERFAAYEITQILQPKGNGGKFQIVAAYRHQSDPMKLISADEGLKDQDTPDLPAEDEIIREIDILICSGGKSSKMKEKFLPSSISVTEQQFYGVSSWLSHHISGNTFDDQSAFPGQHPDQFDLFQDFRGVVHLDRAFRKNYVNRLQEELNSENFNYLDPILKVPVLEFIANDKSFIRFIEEGPENPYVQTRTFENRGLIYVGMEVPTELRHILAAVDQELLKIADEASVEEKRSFESQKDLIMKHFQHSWFQNIMGQYGLDQSNGLTKERIDKNFSIMFPVDQQRLHRDHFFSHIKKGDAQLFVAAAGDANNSPHFMRYSGLTGAREDILGLQKWTKGMAMQISIHDRSILEKQLRDDWERTAEFVISRGTAFLKQLEEGVIKKRRLEKMEKILDHLVEETAKTENQQPYQVIKEEDGNYLLKFQDSLQTIFPKNDGSFDMGGKNYDSFEQIILEMNFQT